MSQEELVTSVIENLKHIRLVQDRHLQHELGVPSSSCKKKGLRDGLTLTEIIAYCTDYLEWEYACAQPNVDRAHFDPR